MVSVVIETCNDEDALAQTLASLVSGAVEGVVREVIVCDCGSTDSTRAVADHTGCCFMADSPLASGIGRAKSEWLLLLEPGSRLREGWMEAVTHHTAVSQRAARLRKARGRAGLFAGIFPPGGPLAAGLLVRRRQAQALTKGDGRAQTMARPRARRLQAEIIVAPRKKGA